MDAYIGMIVCFAGKAVPKNWIACEGQSLHVNEFPKLFSLLSNRYGGDGRYIFKLPDLRGRTPVSVGQAPTLKNYHLAETAGAATVLLNAGHLPAHTHNGNINLKLPAITDPGIDSTVNDGYPSEFTGAYATSGNKYMAAPSYAAGIRPADAGKPINTRSPFLCIKYIICVEGIYPLRP